MEALAEHSAMGSRTGRRGLPAKVGSRGGPQGVPVQARDVLLEGLVLPLQGIGLLQVLPKLCLLPSPIALLCHSPSLPLHCPVCLQAATDRQRPAVQSSQQARVA